MMRHLSLALTVLALAGVGEATATTCYLPSEIEADQAIKLRAELKVVGEVCKDPSYAIFSDRNRDTLAAYEQILSEHLARGGGAADVAAYAKSLETEAMERAGRAPGFCADSFDVVTLFAGMHPSDLHAYAVSKAETAKPDYALCSAPAPVEPAPSNAAPLVSANAAPEPASAAPAVVPPPQPPATSAASVAAPPSAPVSAPTPAPSAAIPTPSPAAQPVPASLEEDIRPSLGDAALARMLNRANRLRLMETTQQTLESARSGQLLGWRDPSSNSGGTVVAARAFQNAQSQWCRRFEQSIVVFGEIRRGGGVACRRPDGIWENVP